MSSMKELSSMQRLALIVLLGMQAVTICSGFNVANNAVVKGPGFKQQQQQSSSSVLYSQVLDSPAVTATSEGNNANEIVPLKQGSTVAIITPMLDNGDIDIASYKGLLQYHIDNDTDNLCILGTTGEASVLTMKEREQIITATVDMCKGQIPIMVGCGTINPAAVKENILQAIDLGCDASLMVTPYYVKPPQRAMVQHFVTAANVGDLPMCLYNVPGRTGVNLEDETILDLLMNRHENIVALKDATGDISRLQSLLQLIEQSSSSATGGRTRSDLKLYSGDDGSTLDFVLNGGDGCISVTANLVPDIMHKMVHTALQGDADQAIAMNEQIKNVHDRIFIESNPIPIKWCMKQTGKIPSAYCRPPMTSMDPKYESILQETLQEAGIIQQ